MAITTDNRLYKRIKNTLVEIIREQWDETKKNAEANIDDLCDKINKKEIASLTGLLQNFGEKYELQQAPNEALLAKELVKLLICYVLSSVKEEYCDRAHFNGYTKKCYEELLSLKKEADISIHHIEELSFKEQAALVYITELPDEKYTSAFAEFVEMYPDLTDNYFLYLEKEEEKLAGTKEYADILSRLIVFYDNISVVRFRFSHYYAEKNIEGLAECCKKYFKLWEEYRTIKNWEVTNVAYLRFAGRLRKIINEDRAGGKLGENEALFNKDVSETFNRYIDDETTGIISKLLHYPKMKMTHDRIRLIYSTLDTALLIHLSKDTSLKPILTEFASTWINFLYASDADLDENEFSAIVENLLVCLTTYLDDNKAREEYKKFLSFVDDNHLISFNNADTIIKMCRLQIDRYTLIDDTRIAQNVRLLTFDSLKLSLSTEANLHDVASLLVGDLDALSILRDDYPLIAKLIQVEMEKFKSPENSMFAMSGSDSPAPAPFTRDFKKIGRNDPCPCGSGKKFKFCCEGKGIYD